MRNLERMAGFVGFEGAEVWVRDGPVYAGVEYVEEERSVRIGGGTERPAMVRESIFHVPLPLI